MNTPEEATSKIAGKVMAAVMSLGGEDGQSIAERMSVADLWLVIEHTTQVILAGDVDPTIRVPLDITGDLRRVWIDPAVRQAIKDERKIVAIKEARAITGMSLKEAKDLVERMIDAGVGT